MHRHTFRIQCELVSMLGSPGFRLHLPSIQQIADSRRGSLWCLAGNAVFNQDLVTIKSLPVSLSIRGHSVVLTKTRSSPRVSWTGQISQTRPVRPPASLIYRWTNEMPTGINIPRLSLLLGTARPPHLGQFRTYNIYTVTFDVPAP